jgi:hypothetical protein
MHPCGRRRPESRFRRACQRKITPLDSACRKQPALACSSGENSHYGVTGADVATASRRTALAAVECKHCSRVSLRSLLSTKLRRSRVVKVMGKLGSDSEELGDEPCFRNNVALCYPSDSPIADHVHGFYSFESSPGTLKGAVAVCQPGPLFDGSMILFNDIVEILALAKMNSAGESTLGFQGFHCSRIGRVLVHVDDPRRCRASPSAENRSSARSNPQPGTDTCLAP